MAGHATAHEKQPMKMIGHHGALKQLNLWVEGWNLPPAPGDGFAKGRMLDALAYKATKQLATPFDFKRDHVDAALEVVMAEASALHGMLYRISHLRDIIPNCRMASKEAA